MKDKTKEENFKQARDRCLEESREITRELEQKKLLLERRHDRERAWEERKRVRMYRHFDLLDALFAISILSVILFFILICLVIP